MKTLVIHPQDNTTKVLHIIYKDKKDWTIINHNTSTSKLRKLIKEHDRIIMMGHGTPHGLLGYNRFVIDSSFVQLLREKKQCVHIWCNADQFIKKYNLKGFTTGMIISEQQEADFCNVIATSEEIDYSITLFAESIKNSIELSSEEMCKKVITDYNSENNTDVMKFNRDRIYFF